MPQSASLILPITEMPVDEPATSRPCEATLNDLPLRNLATITGFNRRSAAPNDALTPEELERRLMEIGFVEGAVVRIEHTGGLAGDPLAIRIDGRRLVALRRQEARFITVRTRATGQ